MENPGAGNSDVAPSKESDVSKPRLYKVHKPKVGWDPIPASQFFGAKFARRECGEPKCPEFPTYLYYCHDPGCEVRQVEVACKHYDGVPAKPPAMHCPSCGGP